MGGFHDRYNSLGGVAGGLCLLFLVLFLVNFFAKRQRQRKTRAWAFRALRDRDTWNAGDQDEGFDAQSFDSGANNFTSIAYTDLRGPSVVPGVPLQRESSKSEYYRGFWREC